MNTNWPYEFPGVYWLDDGEEKALIDVIRNGSMFRYYGLGEPTYEGTRKQPAYVDKFEMQAREYYGAKYALGLNSGTGALITAMQAMDIGPGCEVIVPSFLWVATVSAVIQVGAIPVLCEVNQSFNMDPEDLEKKISRHTKLIVPIHMCGVPCDMDRIMVIADTHNIPVLEDCAQCNGGSLNGKKVGTFGKAGIFSLQLNKNITCGEGGLLITNDESIFTRAFSAHDMGMIRINGRLAMPQENAIMWGAGRRMNELCGAVASVQMSKLDAITRHMRESKHRILESIKHYPHLECRDINDPAGDSGPFIIFSLPTQERASKATEKLKQSGIFNCHHVEDYGLHIYYNIPSLVNKIPLSSSGNPWNLSENCKLNHCYQKGTYPKSDDLFSRSVLIPIPSCLTEQQEQFLITTIKAAVEA